MSPNNTELSQNGPSNTSNSHIRNKQGDAIDTGSSNPPQQAQQSSLDLKH